MDIKVTSMVGVFGNPGLHVLIEEFEHAEWCYRCPDGRTVCWPQRCARVIGDRGFMPVAIHEVLFRGDIDTGVVDAMRGLRRLEDGQTPGDGDILVEFRAVVTHDAELASAIFFPQARYYDWCICCPNGRRECGTPPRCPNGFVGLERVLFSTYVFSRGELEEDFVLNELRKFRAVPDFGRCENRFDALTDLLPDHEWRTSESG